MIYGRVVELLGSPYETSKNSSGLAKLEKDDQVTMKDGKAFLVENASSSPRGASTTTPIQTASDSAAEMALPSPKVPSNSTTAKATASSAQGRTTTQGQDKDSTPPGTVGQSAVGRGARTRSETGATAAKASTRSEEPLPVSTRSASKRKAQEDGEPLVSFLCKRFACTYSVIGIPHEGAPPQCCWRFRPRKGADGSREELK